MARLNRWLVVGVGVLVLGGAWAPPVSGQGGGAAGNLLSNPGFEADGEEWRVWGTWGGMTAAERTTVFAPDPALAHAGARSARLADTWPDHNPYLVQFVPLEATKAYRLSVWARAEYPGAATIGLQYHKGDAYLGGQSRTIRVGDAWARYTLLAANPPAGSDRVAIMLSPTAGDAAALAEVWFDDVVFADETPPAAAAAPAPDTRDWFPYPMPWRTFPVDVSFLLDGPAGKHGFVTTRDDGHFYFEDGTRARFWGTNIHSADALFPTREQAECIAATLARAGVNIVRTHLLENPSPHGLVDSSLPDSQHLSAEAFERFDYLVAKLKEKGIYILPDVMPMCSRVFKPADGLSDGRGGPGGTTLGAKGIGSFNARVIELGQQYARDFLTHLNPYTGKRYLEEPAIAMVQLSNEDNLFLWFAWGDMPRGPSYMAEFTALWNRHLLETYANRAGLAKAWTNRAGECALAADESPEAGTVRLPPLAYFSPRSGRRVTGPDSPARVNDGLLFLDQVATGHYRDMTKWLRELGLKVPVTGSNIVAHPTSLHADAATDYIDHHVYWQHVQYGGQAAYGREIRLTNTPLLRHDPAETAGFVNSLSTGKVRGKPLVVTEWASMWPHEYRSADMLTTAAYACLQDWDALLYYCYMGGWGYSWDKADGDLKDSIPQPTVAFADPAATGLFPATALIFHRRDVRSAERLVEIGYSRVDTFYGQSNGLDPKSALHFLPYISRVRQHFFDTDYDPPRDGVADVVIASGNSSSGNYAAAPRAILSSDNPWQDLHDQAEGKAALWQGLYAGVKLRAAQAEARVRFADWPWPGEHRARGAFDLLELASLPTGAVPFGLDAEGTACLGFRTDRHVVAPSLAAVRHAYPGFFARLYTRTATAWGLLADGRGYRDDGVLVSDTGELVRDSHLGLFQVDTPCTQGAAGFLAAVPAIRLTDLTLVSRTDFGTVSLSSLDGRPLADSARLLLTTVARAANTGQIVRESLSLEERLGSTGGNSLLAEHGRAPVLVQPVELDVTFRTRLTGKTPAVSAIDVQGQRARTVPAALADGRVSFATGKDAATIYYEIRLE